MSLESLIESVEPEIPDHTVEKTHDILREVDISDFNALGGREFAEAISFFTACRATGTPITSRVVAEGVENVSASFDQSKITRYSKKVAKQQDIDFDFLPAERYVEFYHPQLTMRSDGSNQQVIRSLTGASQLSVTRTYSEMLEEHGHGTKKPNELTPEDLGMEGQSSMEIAKRLANQGNGRAPHVVAAGALYIALNLDR